jgi:hypothetical protein
LQIRVSRQNLSFFFDAAGIIHREFAPEGDHSEVSLLFGSDGTSLSTHAICKKLAIPKPQLLLLHELAPSLSVIFEGVSSFQIDLCDPASRLLAIFGTGRVFPFRKMKLTLKGERFSDISNIQHDVTELLKGELKLFESIPLCVSIIRRNNVMSNTTIHKEFINDKARRRVDEQRNLRPEIRKRKANWIGHILKLSK